MTRRDDRPGAASRRAAIGAGYAALVAAFLTFAVPLYWLISTALKRPGDVYTFPPQWLPVNPVLSNFVDAWHAAPFGRYAINSVVTSVVGTALELTLAFLCAYAFAFVPFPGKRVLFGILLGAMMIPGHVVLLPNYLTISGWGWVDTYPGLIVPGLGSAFVTFLLRQHMLTLPQEILDAATADGAGPIRRMWAIVVPLSRPILVTGGIITLIAKWNEYVWPLVVTNTDNMRTLPIGLSFVRTNEGDTRWGVVMAATLFVAAPMLVSYFLAQRHIVAGLTQGATKG